MNKDEGGMGVWGAAAANYRHCACRLRQLDLMYTEVAKIFNWTPDLTVWLVQSNVFRPVFHKFV